MTDYTNITSLIDTPHEWVERAGRSISSGEWSAVDTVTYDGTVIRLVADDTETVVIHLSANSVILCRAAFSCSDDLVAAYITALLDSTRLSRAW